jgi:hypothetical protein
VTIAGPPNFTIEGGVRCDVATASLAIKTIPKILTAPADLRAMRDLTCSRTGSGVRASPYSLTVIPTSGKRK